MKKEETVRGSGRSREKISSSGITEGEDNMTKKGEGVR